MSNLNVVTRTGKNIVVDSMTDAAKVINLNSIATIDEQIAALQAKRTTHVEALWELFNRQHGKHVVPGAGEITFTANNRYDDTAIMAALRPGQQQRVTKRVLDRAKVKSVYPAVYDAAKRYVGYKTSVKHY